MGAVVTPLVTVGTALFAHHEQKKAQKEERREREEQARLAEANRPVTVQQSADASTNVVDANKVADVDRKSRRRRAFSLTDTTNNTTLLGGSFGRKTLG